MLEALTEEGIIVYNQNKEEFRGGPAMERMYGGASNTVPSLANVVAATNQYVLSKINDPNWPTPDISEPHCIYGNEEAQIYKDGGPPARDGSGNEASGNAAVDATRLQRSVRYESTVDFVKKFREGGMQNVEVQLKNCFGEISDWVPLRASKYEMDNLREPRAPTDLMKAFIYLRTHMGWNGAAAFNVHMPMYDFFQDGRKSWTKNTISGGSPRFRIKDDTFETTIIQLDRAYDNDKGNAALDFRTVDLSTIDVSDFNIRAYLE